MSSSRRSTAPKPPPPEVQIQPMLKALLESAREKWTYAIFWQPTSGSAVLGWRDGYYNIVEDGKRARCCAAEQGRRKEVLRYLNGLIFNAGDSVSDYSGAEEMVTDAEWFFLTSMTECFNSRGELPAQAFFDSRPVWVFWSDQADGSGRNRVRKGQDYGLLTMAFIPTENGLVELGSTELLRQDPDLINNVQALFDFTKGDRSSG